MGVSFRMKLGGGHESEQHYTEGYNAGYNMAMDEMRRRTRGYSPHQHHEDYDEVENRRRRRTRGEYDGHDMPKDDVHWPIGFTHEYPVEDRRRRTRGEDDDRVDMLMDMVHSLKEGQEHIKRGMVSTAQKLDPRMAALLETATGVMENPPSTWDAYMKRADYLGIAKMEGKELLSALEAHKPIKDIRKELSHTLAALMMLATK